MPRRKPKSYDEILKGQLPAKGNWNWPEEAAKRARAELSPEDRERLAAQERATDAFVRTGRPHKPKVKKESIMKTLRRVNLIESKNKTNKITQIGVEVQNKMRSGQPVTQAERDIYDKFRSKVHGLAARRGFGKAAKVKRTGKTVDGYDAGIHRPGAEGNVVIGKEVAARGKRRRARLANAGARSAHPEKPRPENANTAYPLTADRVFMFEGKYKDQRMAAERGEAKGALRGPIAKAAMKTLRGSKGKRVGGKLKPATSKAAREAYKRAARSEAGTSKPAKAPEASLPQSNRGIAAGSTEDTQNRIARRGHSR